MTISSVIIALFAALTAGLSVLIVWGGMNAVQISVALIGLFILLGVLSGGMRSPRN